MSPPRIAALWLAAAALALAPAAVRGQAGAAGQSHLAPVRCYEDATEISDLEHPKAKLLCTGATSVAPARCYAQAADRAGLTDLQAVRLCQAATSVAPAACAERLDDTTALGGPSIVAYCAALRWSMVPAGTGGSPQCIQAALDRTMLSDHEAARLCAGARSTGPVACFELGDDQTTLSDGELVDLCTTVVVVAPYQPWHP